MIDETVVEIKDMRTHSSSLVAIKAVDALSELCDRDYATVEEFERAVEHNSNALRRANPSHASLYITQRSIIETLSKANVDSVEDAKDILRETISHVVGEIERGKQLAAENAVEILEDGSTVLTHDFSTTILEAVELAARDGLSFEVYVTEARPRFIGRKMARSLGSIERITPHLIVDSAAGYFLPRCDRVIVGMDCIVDDMLFNRIGTYPIAVTARHANVPVSVVGSSAKVISEGFVFENDFRSAVEVMSEPADGFSIENPAYDGTPVSLLDSVITDDGITTFQ